MRYVLGMLALTRKTYAVQCTSIRSSYGVRSEYVCARFIRIRHIFRRTSASKVRVSNCFADYWVALFFSHWLFRMGRYPPLSPVIPSRLHSARTFRSPVQPRRFSIPEPTTRSRRYNQSVSASRTTGWPTLSSKFLRTDFSHSTSTRLHRFRRMLYHPMF